MIRYLSELSTVTGYHGYTVKVLQTGRKRKIKNKSERKVKVSPSLKLHCFSW